MYHTRKSPFHQSPPLPSPLWLQCISKMLLFSKGKKLKSTQSSLRRVSVQQFVCREPQCSSSFSLSSSSHNRPHPFVLHFHVSAHLREERFKTYLFKLFHYRFTDGRPLHLKAKDINKPTQIQCQLQQEVLSSALSACLHVASTVKGGFQMKKPQDYWTGKTPMFDTILVCLKVSSTLSHLRNMTFLMIEEIKTI